MRSAVTLSKLLCVLGIAWIGTTPALAQIIVIPPPPPAPATVIVQDNGSRERATAERLRQENEQRRQDNERTRIQAEARAAEAEDYRKQVQRQMPTGHGNGVYSYNDLQQGDPLAGSNAASCTQGNGVVIRTSGGFHPAQSDDCKN